MKRFLMAALLISGLTLSLQAQDAPADPAPADSPTPMWDAGKFIMKNHLHQYAGYTTLALASSTGIAALAGWEGHPYLGYATMGSGLVTLTLGITAFHDQLDRVWPHVMFMGLAETGWLLNGFVWEPGSLPHKITGGVSLLCLGLGFLSILLIENS